ncbi:unnamed protein product, partial [Heterobilharzia americana]
MTATGKPRRASAKACLRTICGITSRQISDDSSISENIESEASDYVGESGNNSATTDESVSISENEAEGSYDPGNPSSSSSSTRSLVRESRRPLPSKTCISAVNDKSYLRSPFVRYMRSCRGLIDRDPRSVAPAKFLQALKALKSTFYNIPNPFLCCPSGYKTQFMCRQKALFPTSGAWIRSPIHFKKDHLPQPFISPTYLSYENNPMKLKQFEFDKDSNLVYVGGAVTCLSWCPPRLYSLLDSDSIANECSFLATASTLTPDLQTLYSDGIKSGPGTIQIWNCGVLGLTETSSTLNPEIHFIISHDWGRIIDMCWVPVSPLSGIKQLQSKACLHGSYMVTTPETDRILGHLIVASQDGYVRVFSIPTCPMNFGCENLSVSKFTYTLSKNCSLTLSPSVVAENPHWLGWPTCLHIRREFPDRLFVGYTTGHVCYYNLSSLNELVYSSKFNHLAPVKMSRLTSSPVITISLHPLNGKMLFVQGLERIAGIWDLNDSVCFTSESGEISWNPVHGFMGREGMWISNGEFLVTSRETWFTSAVCKSNQHPKWAALFDNMDNCSCIPLGIQSLTSMDFSDFLNGLVCSTDRGRIEAVAESVEKRRCDPARPKYIPEMRIPLCQWTMKKAPIENFNQSVKNESKLEVKEEDEDDFNKYNYDIIDINAFLKNNGFNDISINITDNHDTINTDIITRTIKSEVNTSKEFDDMKFQQSIFSSSSNCRYCELEHSICCHKVWSNYQLDILLKEEVPMKPEMDFINTPMLKINKVRFNPNPTAATWIAVANSLGFIHFICVEQLYCKCFDTLLNRIPTGKDSVYLELKPKDVISRPINSLKQSQKNRRKPYTSSNSTVKKSVKPIQVVVDDDDDVEIEDKANNSNNDSSIDSDV